LNVTVRATVVRISAFKICDAVAEGDSLLITFSHPGDDAVHLGDTLSFQQPAPSDSVEVVNVTRGVTFNVTLKPENLHDLRRPASHGSSRPAGVDQWTWEHDATG
jgi:hypothetical protein